MTVYIASSWKNQHAVEMLTDLLQKISGVEVRCFVRKSNEEYVHTGDQGAFDFDEWMKSKNAQNSFEYDTKGASTSDLVIYIGPSGTDAWSEVGIAWASKIPIIGLYAKGEQSGLMRKLMTKWYDDYQQVVSHVHDMNFVFKAND